MGSGLDGVRGFVVEVRAAVDHIRAALAHVASVGPRSTTVLAPVLSQVLVGLERLASESETFIREEEARNVH